MPIKVTVNRSEQTRVETQLIINKWRQDYQPLEMVDNAGRLGRFIGGVSQGLKETQKISSKGMAHFTKTRGRAAGYGLKTGTAIKEAGKKASAAGKSVKKAAGSRAGKMTLTGAAVGGAAVGGYAAGHKKK